MLDALIIQQCAPMVNHELMLGIINVESSNNPYAIGVVNAHLQRQPQNLAEAKVTAQHLERAGYNYSVGVAQVNRSNFNRFNLTLDNAFDTCTNLKAGGQILAECIKSAVAQGYQQEATNKALSCYYSGHLNSKVGMQYADKVIAKLTLASHNTSNGAMQPTAVIDNRLTNKSAQTSNNNVRNYTTYDKVNNTTGAREGVLAHYLQVANAEAWPETNPTNSESAMVF